VFLLQARGEMEIMPAVPALLFHHSAVDTYSDCSFVSTG